MWRLWHRLFGWHYVYWWNSADQGVRRVHIAANGELYFYQYYRTSVIVWMKRGFGSDEYSSTYWRPLTWGENE